MTFELGDKVQTVGGLYISGAWREGGLKGKVVDTSRREAGLITVKFKGIEDTRFIRPEYLSLRKKANRPFKAGDTVALTEDVRTNSGGFTAGADAEVVGLVPDSKLVFIKFLSGTELTVSEDVLTKTEVVEDVPPALIFDRWPEDESLIVPGAEVVLLDSDTTEEDCYDPGYVEKQTVGIIQSVNTEDRTIVAKLTYDDDESTTYVDTLDFDEFTVTDLPSVKESREVKEALALILERIEEIKALLTAGPRQEIHVTVNEALPFVAPDEEEEPAPEPVFKKAKEVNEGDMLYTEGGAWDKVNQVETKDSGYTSLYGVFGNKIAQVPSGRVVQVLEPVS